MQGPLRQGWGDLVRRHHGREENEASLAAVFTIPAISVGSSGPSALEKLGAAPSRGDSEPATQKDEREKMSTPPSRSDTQWLSWQLQTPFLRSPPMLMGSVPSPSVSGML